MILPVSAALKRCEGLKTPSDYEQQRRDLLRKHGIDLEDGNGDAAKTRRMDRREAEKIMGEGPGGVFTWREKHRKKVCGYPP